MKKLVKVEEVAGEGFLALIGENVLIFCMSYIYTGRLVDVNDEFIKLEEAKLVYDTGAFDKPGYDDAQSLPGKIIYIMKCNVEAFGVGK